MNSTIITISDAVPAAAVSQHEPCPSWCTSHDNHLEDESGRYHFGPERTVTLTLEKAQICQTADGEPVVFPSELTAYLEQRDQHRESPHQSVPRRRLRHLPHLGREARELAGGPSQGPPRGGQLLVEPPAGQIKTMPRQVLAWRGIARWYAHRQSTPDNELHIKIIPHVDCTPRICELVRYYCEDVTLKGAWAGPAALQLFDHALCDVNRLPVREVLSATHFVTDLTLGLGEVVHDYLAKA